MVSGDARDEEMCEGDFKLTPAQVDELLERFDQSERRIQRQIVAELVTRNVKLKHELSVANLALELAGASRTLNVCRCGGVIMRPVDGQQ